MDNSNQKRKHQDEEEESERNKKHHSELEFSGSLITAESTKIEDFEDSDLVNTVIETNLTGSNEVSREVDADESQVETIVSICKAITEEKSSLVDEIRRLKRDIQNKEEEAKQLKKQNKDLLEKVTQFEEESKVDRDKIKRYKKTIIKLNEIAKLHVPKQTDDDISKSKESSKENNAEVTKQDGTSEEIFKKKCKYENGGKCKDKNLCGYFHPKRTCQNFSKLGSCPSGFTCKLRHPKRTCREWEERGECQWSDRCRFRHPLEQSQSRFLGLKPPNPPKPTQPQTQQQLYQLRIQQFLNQMKAPRMTIMSNRHQQ